MRSTRRIRTGNSAGAAQNSRNAHVAGYLSAAAIAASRSLSVQPNVVVVHGVCSRLGVTLCAWRPAKGSHIYRYEYRYEYDARRAVFPTEP